VSPRVPRFALLAAFLVAPSILHADEPFRLAVMGLVHGHAGGFIDAAAKRDDIRLVGVSEPDAAVRGRYQEGHRLAPALLFADAEEMLTATKPDAVALFTNTFDHTAAVELLARRGLPVMMEKPLAVSVEHGRRIERAVAASGIPLVVNYETTWYPSNHEAHRLRSAIGDIRKIVVHDGHAGPRAIGVQPEFLDWLLDPVRNGGGALFDFGCYGADLATWLMEGARPESVTAVTQRLQPDLYPRVDDEATVVVTYPRAVAILQASWNWPFGRKDMEVYGVSGQVITVAQKEVRRRLPGGAEEQVAAPPLPAPFTDPLSYLKAVARREIAPSGLSSLATNLVATEILDAARRSAETGATIRLAR
jgi:predicted dehydrogenase